MVPHDHVADGRREARLELEHLRWYNQASQDYAAMESMDFSMDSSGSDSADDMSDSDDDSSALKSGDVADDDKIVADGSPYAADEESADPTRVRRNTAGRRSPLSAPTLASCGPLTPPTLPSRR